MPKKMTDAGVIKENDHILIECNAIYVALEVVTLKK